MNLHVMSDLHVDMWSDSYTEDFFDILDTLPSTEILVLAGDVGEMGPWTLTCIKRLASRYKKVLYTLGNHEFWRSSFESTYKCVEGLQTYGTASNVYLLKTDTWTEHRGKTFGGDTGWYPAHKKSMEDNWSDFRAIRDGRKNIAKAWKNGVANTSIFPEVFVTHHFPTTESIHRNYEGSPSNQYFHSGLDSRLAKLQKKGVKFPKLWIHGHTHNPFNYTSRYGFRVFANPHGYPNEGSNPSFWDRVLVTI